MDGWMDGCTLMKRSSRLLQSLPADQPLSVPGSVLILGPSLSLHPTAGEALPAASHRAPTLRRQWERGCPCSNGLLLMSRTNRDQHLFFICQRFNDMDSALIKAALLELRPHL